LVNIEAEYVASADATAASHQAWPISRRNRWDRPETPPLRWGSTLGSSRGVKRPGFHVGSTAWKPRSPGRLAECGAPFHL